MKVEKVEIDSPVRTGFYIGIGAFCAILFVQFLVTVVQTGFAVVTDPNTDGSTDVLLALFGLSAVAVFFVALVATKSRPAEGDSD